MDVPARPSLPIDHRLAVIGAGFSGTVFTIKLSAARPDWQVVLIEPHRPAVAWHTRLKAIMADGTLTLASGRVLAMDAGTAYVSASVPGHGEKPRLIEADHAILCT